MKARSIGGLRYYFAYGSNMHLTRMRARCPRAILMGAGVVRGWRLCERIHADIEKTTRWGSLVWGGVWLIDRGDEEALERYEGVAGGYYSKEVVRVELKDGRVVPAMVYIMTPEAREFRSGGGFSPSYREVCREGAKMLGIPIWRGYSAPGSK